jgi:hypothetical protein
MTHARDERPWTVKGGERLELVTSQPSVTPKHDAIEIRTRFARVLPGHVPLRLYCSTTVWFLDLLSLAIEAFLRSWTRTANGDPEIHNLEKECYRS